MNRRERGLCFPTILTFPLANLINYFDGRASPRIVDKDDDLGLTAVRLPAPDKRTIGHAIQIGLVYSRISFNTKHYRVLRVLATRQEAKPTMQTSPASQQDLDKLLSTSIIHQLLTHRGYTIVRSVEPVPQPPVKTSLIP